MSSKTRNPNPLMFIDDQLWVKLVDLITENVFALNSLKLFKVDILYTEGGHYPAVYFRLTTILEDSIDSDIKTEVSGFVFGFNNDWDDDVYIHPLSPLGFWDEWLKENQITSIFNYHEVGLRRLNAFIERELKLWEIPEEPTLPGFSMNEWRLLKEY